MRVLVPTALRSYTAGKAEVEGRGETLREVLEALDEDFPGVRFRIVDEQDGIRTHIKFFVGGEPAASLDAGVGEGVQVQIICALSGG